MINIRVICDRPVMRKKTNRGSVRRGWLEKRGQSPKKGITAIFECLR